MVAIEEEEGGADTGLSEELKEGCLAKVQGELLQNGMDGDEGEEVRDGGDEDAKQQGGRVVEEVNREERRRWHCMSHTSHQACSLLRGGGERARGGCRGGGALRCGQECPWEG